jgi:hypothetical protein
MHTSYQLYLDFENRHNLIIKLIENRHNFYPTTNIQGIGPKRATVNEHPHPQAAP